MRILQFTAIHAPPLTARLIRATRRIAATVVLDLEDSLWDVVDETATPTLKAAGRANLVALAGAHPELFAQQSIGVRINRISGPDAALDFEALGRATRASRAFRASSASRAVEFECVIPTKVESGADIRENLAGLRHHGVTTRAIVPIVETRAGLANLDEIAEAARSAGIEWLVYGHFDLALDSGWWPFPEPGEARYWEAIEPLILRWESAGLGWVQPPYFDTRDRSGLAAIVARLARTCAREFGIVTVGPRQTEAVDRLSRRAGLSGGQDGERTGERTAERTAQRTADAGDPADLARHVVQTYLGTRRPGAGFALDSGTGEFISPHVYLAARDYLRRVAQDSAQDRADA